MSIISKPSPEACGLYYSKRKYYNKHVNDPLSQDILKNKRGDAFAAERIASIMDRYVVKHEYLLNDVTQIIPVPNYGSDNKCNAPLLAEIFAEKIRKRTGKNIHSYPGVLARSDKTRQRLSGQVERRLSAEIDYKISDYTKYNNNLIKDNRLLLIDDIVTTGSTIEVCQDLLYSNGARTVYILCAARTAP